MDICYASDNSFSMQTGVSMLSLLAQRESEPIRFHLLDAGIHPENRQLLCGIAAEAGAQIRFYPVQQLLARVQAAGQRHWGDFPSYATWARLFLPQLLPEDVTRLLYLDGDVLVTAPFARLRELELGENLLAAVEDCVTREYRQSIGLSPSEPYFNAGVLLLDMAAWRRVYRADWVETWLNGSIRYPMADQDVLNRMFAGQCRFLPLRYNDSVWFRALPLRRLKQLMGDPDLCRHTPQDIRQCRESAVFLHYNTCNLLVRPWYQGATDPDAARWQAYYRRSPWAGQPLQPEPARWTRGQLRDRSLYRMFGAEWYVQVHALDVSLRRLVRRLRGNR